MRVGVEHVYSWCERSEVGVFLGHSSVYLLRQSLSLRLELAHSAYSNLKASPGGSLVSAS